MGLGAPAGQWRRDYLQASDEGEPGLGVAAWMQLQDGWAGVGDKPCLELNHFSWELSQER